MTEIRSFNRTDREQLTELVNAHIAVAVPGWAVPVAALLGQLEREPGEYVVDPWVMERMTLVSVVQDRVVAGAHLKRYAADPRVSEGYADSAEITWLVCWPESIEAGHALAQTCVRVLEAWGGRHHWADGALPTPATYGVADAWPHVRAILERAGFRDEGAQTEVHLAGRLDDVPSPGPAPIEGLVLQRELGNMATRFAARLEGEVLGFLHVRDDLTRGGSMSRLTGWSDMWELYVEPGHRSRGIGTWLVEQAVDWLRLGRTERILVTLSGDDVEAGVDRFLARFGWRAIGRTRRGWKRQV